MPFFAALWLPIVTIAAFAVAAARQGDSSSPWLQGAVAATGSYVLILPLVLINPLGRDPLQITMTVVAAVVVGSIMSHLLHRYRDRLTTHD